MVLTLHLACWQRLQDRWTPLHFASRDGDKAVVEVLLAHRARVDAASNVSVSVVQRLMRGSSFSITSLSCARWHDVLTLHLGSSNPAACWQWLQNGETPLHWAAFDGHKDVIEVLLAKGADVKAVDEASVSLTSLHGSTGGRDLAL